jgi:hypothetical protein
MSRDLLVGVGACLVVIGVVMRGLARSNRRDQAHRKQHDLAAADTDLAPAPDAIDRHLEKWLPRYGAVCIAGGAFVIVLGFVAG